MWCPISDRLFIKEKDHKNSVNWSYWQIKLHLNWVIIWKANFYFPSNTNRQITKIKFKNEFHIELYSMKNKRQTLLGNKFGKYLLHYINICNVSTKPNFFNLSFTYRIQNGWWNPVEGHQDYYHRFASTCLRIIREPCFWNRWVLFYSQNCTSLGWLIFESNFLWNWHLNICDILNQGNIFKSQTVKLLNLILVASSLTYISPWHQKRIYQNKNNYQNKPEINLCSRQSLALFEVQNGELRNVGHSSMKLNFSIITVLIIFGKFPPIMWDARSSFSLVQSQRWDVNCFLLFFTEDGNGDVIRRNRPEPTVADTHLGYRNQAYDSNEVGIKCASNYSKNICHFAILACKSPASINNC